jgi:hypothetical protein
LVSALDHVFDDAALFPPVRRPMAEALRAHAEATTGPHARLVGPFLCPISRLDELDACVAGGLPRPAKLGVVAYGADDLSRLGRRPGAIRGLDRFEAPLGTKLPDLGGRVARYLEIPRGGPVGEALDAVRAAGGRVKLRFAGAGQVDSPSAARVADVLVGCVERSLVLRATAGLHHPFRPSGARPGQHGSINLLAAAAAAVGRADRATVTRLLSLEEPEAVPLLDGLSRARELVQSVGVCSIDEPVVAFSARGLL